MSDLATWRDDIRRSSRAGVPFLLVNGLGWLLLGGLFLSGRVMEQHLLLAVVFMGAVTTPLSFGVQAAMRLPKADPQNPLTPLAIQLSFVQVIALPAVIVVYGAAPAYVPAVFAAIVGGHFVPYAWLQSTRIYVFLAVAVSVTAFVLAMLQGVHSPGAVCVATGGWLLLAVPFLHRHGK